MTVLFHEGERVLFRGGVWRLTPTALVALVNGSEVFWVELSRQALADPELPLHVLCKSWAGRDDFAAAYRHACQRPGVPAHVAAANLAATQTAAR